MAVKNLKVLVVGCGNMGASHARAYHKIQGFDLVGIISRTSSEARKNLANELGGIQQFNDFETALIACKPDVVCISSYTNTHKEFAIKSLKANAHVFVEKPIAANISDAEEVVSLANELKKKVVVGYILRQHPAWVQFIKIAQGLGKPLVMRMNLNQQSCGAEWDTHKQLMETTSPIVDCGVHYVDVMCQMTKSRPVKVHAIGVKLTEEVKEGMYNYGQLQVTFTDGSVGWYESGWGPMMSETAYFVKDVIGPMGSVSIAEQTLSKETDSSTIDEHTKTNNLIVHFEKRNRNGTFLKKDEIINSTDEPDHLELCIREQQYLYDAIINDIDLSSHLKDSIESLKIVLAADKSIKSGQVIYL